jgi:hypothetical protein
VTDSNGNYRVTLQAAAPGNVHGVTSDGESNFVDAGLSDTTDAPLPPVIDRFDASQGDGNWWTFRGHVTCTNPSGLTVNFGGQPVSLTNQHCTVDDQGNFSFLVHLNGTTSDNGMATAEVTDRWGQTSDAMWYVNQT